MTWQTIRDDITVTYPQLSITGPVSFDSDQCALAHIDLESGEAVLLSIHLPKPLYDDEVWVMDWSEHRGWAKALERAGVVEIIDSTVVGPFDARAYLCRVLTAPTAR